MISLVFCAVALVSLNCFDDDREDDPTMLVIYNAGTHDGNLGGRSGADSICRNSGNRPGGLSNVHAFISISSTDEIMDMPGMYGYSTASQLTGPTERQK